MNRNKRIVNYKEEPPLWCEGYTDFFSINVATKGEDIEECVEQVMAETGNGGLLAYSKYQYATSDQIVVEKLKEYLYSYEIAFRHEHIPLFYGEE